VIISISKADGRAHTRLLLGDQWGTAALP
jgi:hypothetical protein